jgi:tRNA-splicing ligase RtcB
MCPEAQKVPIHAWLSSEESLEEKAWEQAQNAASLPFAFHHIALMPDAHFGYGAPIGGVLASEGIIVVNFVGVDIGCGMCAQKLPIQHITIEQLKKAMGIIRQTIPVGFSHHKQAQDSILMPEWDHRNVIPICQNEYSSALCQLGTLGGGNHFIEIQKGSDGFLYIMIHSGSRHLGMEVAKYYNEGAIALNEKWYSTVPTKWELAFLPVDTEEGQNYINEMSYCVDFALANRRLMMVRAIQALQEATIQDDLIHPTQLDPMINIAHNYATLENHYGKNVWVHRKGATRARLGEIGIIPGSQGSKSYIVKGLGKKESFESCSHGAGRKMGRKEAQRTLNLAEEIKKLDDQGIIHSVRTADDLDEATGSYKDIDEVINNQKDLVEKVIELTPLAVVKG